MTDPARRQHLLVNLRSQPMEIHRGVDVLVLPPRGRVELLDSDLALPQLHALLAGRQVAILEWNAPPDAATSATDTRKPHTTRPARASPVGAKRTRSAAASR
jgi:hypothetical protein